MMEISIHETGQRLHEQLRDRLQRAADLRCDEHGRAVAAVTITACENGWFDSRWTTCCESLMKQASAIVRLRI